ncbi:hypothetical protein PVAND_000097 [Polypedilum vanderplanki]|uniref:CRAL-TRIO domain-containing protein n=1 Tax=Polypedilum vanderplanki TaxID=319348 RepID=A0A9J6BJ01_POLVA|nr:hypothetical protein PVAND_000097 [Polypedilum vanderplanki]
MTNPSNLLSYSEVPEHIIKKSKGEIREDESRKQQSLQQFKEWIAKHPFIKRCTTDDRHLIPFLRTKKYKMDEVFDIFEKALIFIKSHENWYNFSEENLKRNFDLYDAGFIRVTKIFDSNGRKTIFVNHKNLILKNLTIWIFRIHCLVAPILADDEASQICGVNYVLDLSEDFTMKHLTICPLKQLLEFVSSN